jgi:hypothetical protein
MTTQSEGLRSGCLLDVVMKYDGQFTEMFSCLLLIRYLCETNSDFFFQM